MQRKIIPIGLLVLVAIIVCLLFVRYDTSEMSFNQKPPNAQQQAAFGAPDVSSATASTTELNGITYEIVTTQAAQERGLGGRALIPNNYAMLFVFPSNSMPGFWMKDMLAPIDMTWVTASGTIAAINDTVIVSSYPGVFYPPYPIKYVLETRAGFARAQGWHVGTTLALPAPY